MLAIHLKGPKSLKGCCFRKNMATLSKPGHPVFFPTKNQRNKPTWEVNLPWFGASVLRSMFSASYASLALWAGTERVG